MVTNNKENELRKYATPNFNQIPDLLELDTIEESKRTNQFLVESGGVSYLIFNSEFISNYFYLVAIVPSTDLSNGN